MRDFRNDDLLELLAGEDSRLRMLALHFLCEGYAEDERLLPLVFTAWDRWGVAEAFTEFPLLSYLPVTPPVIEECCQRASHMVAGRKLTDPVTRCAGKLIEQVVRLPVSELGAHLLALEEVTAQSKIFFRVDLDGLRERLSWMEQPADALAERLDEAIFALAQNQDRLASGLHALEALRLYHPDYLDLANVVARRPVESGPPAASFQLTMQSLLQQPQPGLEVRLSQHLKDEREGVQTIAVEALVRAGTPKAAAAFVSQFESADNRQQQWIARGLQRVRAAGLADAISELRARTTDPTLWLMLLIAELRQFNFREHERVTAELNRLVSHPEALRDALDVYNHLRRSNSSAQP